MNFLCQLVGIDISWDFMAVKMFQLQCCLLHLPPFFHNTGLFRERKTMMSVLHSFCMILLWQHSSELCLWGLPIFDHLWWGNKNPFDKAPLGWIKHCIKHAGQMCFAMKEMTNNSQAMEDIENTPQVFFNDLGTSWKFLYWGRIRTFSLVTRTQHHTYVLYQSKSIDYFCENVRILNKVAKTFVAPAFLLFGVVNFNRCFTRNTKHHATTFSDDRRPCRRFFFRCS